MLIFLLLVKLFTQALKFDFCYTDDVSTVIQGFCFFFCEALLKVAKCLSEILLMEDL